MSELIEVFRRRRPRNRDQYLIPAPTGGLDRRSPITAMPIENALELVNLRPDRGFARKRNGSRLHATVRVTDSAIEDTMPPQLAQVPPAQSIGAGAFFEIPLLNYLEAELVPITFVIHEVDSGGLDSDWLGITDHGVLYGQAPEPTSAQTFRASVCATDPARNTLRFDVVLLVLPGDPPAEEAATDPLATPTGLLASRNPQAWSPLVAVEFDRVPGADSYEIRHRNDGGTDEAGWTVVQEPASSDLLVLEGADHVVQVRAISDDAGVENSAWTASATVPDQEGRPLVVPTLRVSRASESRSDDVTLTASALPTGVTALAYQTRQNAGVWGTATALPDGDTSATISRTGSGWEVRWAPFTVQDGYAANAAGDPVAVPDQEALDVPPNLRATRTPAATDATVRYSWGQVEDATGYELELSEGGSVTDTVTIDGRTTTHHDVEQAGSDFTARVRAKAPTDWIDSEYSAVAAAQDQAGTIGSVATSLLAVRPDLQMTLIRGTWTPHASATAQVVQFRQGGEGVWMSRATTPAAITATTSEVTALLPGTGWTMRVGTSVS